MNIAEELDLLEKKFVQLKLSYDQYFLGLGTVKIEPSRERDDLQRKIAIITNVVINNTGLKFKFQSFVGKFNSYSALWSRQMRLKEEGKLFAAQSIKTEQVINKLSELEPKASDEWTNERIDKLFNKVNDVSLGLNGKQFSKNQLKGFIEKSIIDIRSKYNKDVIDFNVVVKDGKIKFVPVLK